MHRAEARIVGKTNTTSLDKEDQRRMDADTQKHDFFMRADRAWTQQEAAADELGGK